jgi:hypothetical protein
VIFFVCRVDGTEVGQFQEADFRDKVFARQIKPDDYYWHDGMADWRPISKYRALAKTQRISFAPPVRPTVKIDTSKPISVGQPRTVVTRFLDRIRRRK